MSIDHQHPASTQRTEHKSFGTPDETRSFERGVAEILRVFETIRPRLAGAAQAPRQLSATSSHPPTASDEANTTSATRR